MVGILERAPPSRPAPVKDQPLVKPHFDNSTSTRVVGAVSRTAFLHCRVKHLGDRAVSNDNDVGGGGGSDVVLVAAIVVVDAVIVVVVVVEVAV